MTDASTCSKTRDQDQFWDCNFEEEVIETNNSNVGGSVDLEYETRKREVSMMSSVERRATREKK